MAVQTSKKMINDSNNSMFLINDSTFTVKSIQKTLPSQKIQNLSRRDLCKPKLSLPQPTCSHMAWVPDPKIREHYTSPAGARGRRQPGPQALASQ